MRHGFLVAIVLLMGPGCSSGTAAPDSLSPGPDGRRDARRDAHADAGADTGSAEAGVCPGPRPAPTEWMSWTPPSPTSDSYVTTSDTVLDKQTCLMWERAVSSPACDWQHAKDYCKTLRLAGHDDWRVPTAVELKSILDRSRHSPSINVSAFPATPATVELNWYWTSTPTARDPAYAWIVGFLYGVTSPCAVTDSNYVRCVR
jgi:hypothetical protein